MNEAKYFDEKERVSIDISQGKTLAINNENQNENERNI